MKLLYLSIENQLEDKKHEINFSVESANAIVVNDEQIPKLQEYLLLGFYGEGDNGKVEVAYEYNGEEYLIKRNFDNNLVQLFYRNGDLICEGEEKVNAQIKSHIKLNKEAFSKLAIINPKETFENFIKPAQEREHYVGGLLDELVFDKAEITLIEKRIKEKHEQTEMKIQAIKEPSPKQLKRLKEEITQEQVVRRDIKAELQALYKNIYRAEEGIEAQSKLKDEELLLNEAKEKIPTIEELYLRLKTNNEAQIIDKLMEQKQSILERDKIISQRIEDIAQQIDEASKAIEKGQIAQEEKEQALISCLEKVQDFRKGFYDKIESLSHNEDVQNTIMTKVKSFYKNQQQELDTLYAQKANISKELLALEQEYTDIYLHQQRVQKKANIKGTIREGAMLEAEIKKLEGVLSDNKLELDAYKIKKEKVKNKITRKRSKLGKKYDELEDLFKANKEVLNDTERNRRDFFEYYIQIVAQQKEINSIEEKMDENKKQLVNYTEELQLVENLKNALLKYISQQKKNKENVEVALIDLHERYKDLEVELDLEVQEDNIKASELRNIINKRTQDLDEANKILNENDEKLYYLNQREEETKARIEINKAHFDCLKEDKNQKEACIRGLLRKGGVTDFYQLTEKLNAIEQKHAQFDEEREEFDAMLDNEWQVDALLLRKELLLIEEERLPQLISRQEKAQELLKNYREELKAIEKVLGSRATIEKLGEAVIAEKECERIAHDVANKRKAIHDLIEQKEKIIELIDLLENKQRKIFLEDREYDYTSLNIKVVADWIGGDPLRELRSYEEQAEQLKAELLGLKKVIGDYSSKRNKQIQELDRLHARLESDKEILKQLMSDFNNKMAILQIENTKELRKRILNDKEKQAIKDDIALCNGAIVLHQYNVNRYKNIIEKQKKHIEAYEEYKQLSEALEKRDDELSYKIATISARRKEMQSRAKQRLALKEKQNKYTNKLRVLDEVINLIKENGDITDYIIKLASKKLYAITKGRYNIGITEGELSLFDNNKGGKAVNKQKFSQADKLLISLVLSVSLKKTLLDMIGGEPFMHIFVFKDEGIKEPIIQAVSSYTKKESIIAAVENDALLEFFK